MLKEYSVLNVNVLSFCMIDNFFINQLSVFFPGLLSYVISGGNTYRNPHFFFQIFLMVEFKLKLEISLANSTLSLEPNEPQFHDIATLWANSADNKLIFFLIFSRKYVLIFHAIVSKLSPLETVCMKCQSQVSWKTAKTISKCLLKF